jgi:hypothetical protein
MSEHPAQRSLNAYTFPLRGIIAGVRFKDDGQNRTGQTLVDISLLDGYPALYNVPLLYHYINKDNGEEWTPEVGAIVLVQFIAGNFRLPVVTG